MKEPAVFIFKVVDYSKPGKISVTLSRPVHAGVEAYRGFVATYRPKVWNFNVLQVLSALSGAPTNQPINQELNVGGNFVVAQIRVPQSVALLLHMKWVRLSCKWHQIIWRLNSFGKVNVWD